MKKISLSKYNHEQIPSDGDFKIGIIYAEWNQEITHLLRDASKETLVKHGVKVSDITVASVPGAYELPMGARILLSSESYDAIICIGCVIKGETSHNEYINNSVAQGLQQLSLTSGTPCIFGLLTPNSYKQAEERAGGKHGNKGVEAAVTALKMIGLAKKFKEQQSKIGFQ